MKALAVNLSNGSTARLCAKPGIHASVAIGSYGCAVIAGFDGFGQVQVANCDAVLDPCRCAILDRFRGLVALEVVIAGSIENTRFTCQVRLRGRW